ncbi:Uncharacterised protein [BD1-7 clade bacterium]|uniref:DUF2970 domain-containing protein n=1 Tax=BD1-7 clade bacterium TaxID=2029982 RepID=A0A5S9P6V5_9GAMM|nr:Uncharacterised protein [BD1-7 clade bacterium]CAA0099352.1 Uncharacterised protein [BD1-7 clade bacterium]
MTGNEQQTPENSAHSEPASAFKHPKMAEMQTDDKDLNRKLSKGEMIREAFSLIFALQGMEKFQRAADQLEKKPFRIVIAGVISIALFMGFCFTAANLALLAAKTTKAETKAKIEQPANDTSTALPSTPAKTAVPPHQ